MSGAQVTEAHLETSRRLIEAMWDTSEYISDEEQTRAIAQALAEAGQAEREAIANWHDRQARYYKSNEMYPAYCLNAQVSTHEESAAAIRARGNPAKGQADG